MTDYNNYGEAKQSLIDNKFAYTQWKKGEGPKTATHDQMEDYLDGYAKIIVFLSSPEVFKTALTKISKLLWSEYLNFSPKLRNKFTRALSLTASQYNFSFQNRHYLNTGPGAPLGILLVGGDPQLGYMLRNKLFWKDSMDLHHGEHSHTLQWLAIAEAATKGKISIPDLYSESSNFRIMTADDSKGQRSLTLWQWLADSFPESMKKYAETLKNGHTLVTHTFRAPQTITDYLFKSNQGLPIADHFVSNYLYYRYMNRGWLTATWKYQDNKYKLSAEKHYTGDPSSQSSDTLANKGWKQSARVENRYLRNSAVSYADKNAQYLTLKFHNQKGQLYFHNMQGIKKIMAQKPK